MSAPTAGRTLDHAAGVYDLLSPLMTFGQEGRISDKVTGLLELKANKKILDIGCGTGTLTIKIAQRFEDEAASLVVGLDAAGKMIKIARKKSLGLKNVRFDIVTAEELTYPDEYFDSAVSTFFFHHVNFGLKQKVLQEAWRVLKKNGELIIADVDIPGSLWGWICAWSGYFLFNQEEIRENIEGKLREAFDGSGFRSWHTLSNHLGYISLFKLIK